MSSHTPNIVFGAGGIGGTEKSFTYTWTDASKTSTLLNTLQDLGIKELDSAASYPPSNPWNTETLLGESHAVQKGFLVDSKVAAHIPNPHLSAEQIEQSIDKTLRLLGAGKVRVLYAHRQDDITTLEDQLEGFDRQFRAGKFERLGICNYTTAQMREMFSICEAKGYAKPTVYQGHYNPLMRNHEDHLIPLLREHGCAYYAFSPLAGGFLTGKVTFGQHESAQSTSASTPPNATDSEGVADPDPSDPLHRTRWRGASAMSYYPTTFDKPAMHAAVRLLKAACDSSPLTSQLSLQEATLRWLMHHSVLRAGDGIILGAKREEQLIANVEAARRGPLPEELRIAVEGMWGAVKGEVPSGAGDM